MYQITGPEQKRPTDWLSALRNDNFKESFVQFLTSYWDSDAMAPFLGAKELFVNCKDRCFSFKVIDGRMVKSEVDELHLTHE